MTHNEQKQPLRVIFAGTPEFAAVSLRHLLQCKDALNIDIVAVYTQPDRKSGRGQKITPSPVKIVAQEYGIAVEQPHSFSLKHEDGAVSRETLASYQADVMIVAAYGLILPLGVLNTPKFGCLNIHASLLPRWRGAAPIHRSILAGDDETGITIMQMNQGLDTGDMLYKVACPIGENDTTQTLHDKLAALGGKAIEAVLKNLEFYQQNATAQDETLVTYAEKVHSKDGQIRWENSATQIHRQIRALSSYTYLKGERIKVIAALPIKHDQVTTLAAGSVVSVGKNAILVACGADESGVQHLINLTCLQWAGGKPLNAEQIVNGDKLNDGDIFEMMVDG